MKKLNELLDCDLTAYGFQAFKDFAVLSNKDDDLSGAELLERLHICDIVNVEVSDDE